MQTREGQKIYYEIFKVKCVFKRVNVYINNPRPKRLGKLPGG